MSGYVVKWFKRPGARPLYLGHFSFWLGSRWVADPTDATVYARKALAQRAAADERKAPHNPKITVAKAPRGRA